jgi:hypothetical protein
VCHFFSTARGVAVEAFSFREYTLIAMFAVSMVAFKGHHVYFSRVASINLDSDFQHLFDLYKTTPVPDIELQLCEVNVGVGPQGPWQSTENTAPVTVLRDLL